MYLKKVLEEKVEYWVGGKTAWMRDKYVLILADSFYEDEILESGVLYHIECTPTSKAMRYLEDVPEWEIYSTLVEEGIFGVYLGYPMPE